MIKVDHLTKTFPTAAALDNIDIEFHKGQITGLVGPDGAGKTTLMRLIAALLLPTSGSISIFGFDTVKDAETIHDITGYMPQRFGLYEDLTVMQNLKLYAELREVDNQEELFSRLLQFTGLKPFIDRMAGDLSGGMKQKLGLACALIKKPQLLLLDEPSVGVDPLSRRELWKMVTALLDQEIAIIWSTTYLDEAEKCDRVVLLNEGKVLYQGKPADLTKRVEGRVYKLSADRNQLAALENDPEIIDAMIQGQQIRVVSHNPVKNPVTPRFEDAFIDILTNHHRGSSILAGVIPPMKQDENRVIVADHLTKKFGSFTAADNISFEVKKGEIFGLLGPNGAGKSTTFKMLCGLLKPTSGHASVYGKDLLVASAEARSHIGYMAQKFSLYGNLNVRQNLDFFSTVYAAEKSAVDKMIEIFKLEPYLDIAAESLPLGVKQRLSMAAALMHWPPVLFLDEPTSGMDPVSRREFWSHINEIVRCGRTVMVTTHFMDEAEYCDRIALIYRGKIIHLDTPTALKQSAKSEANPNPTLEDAFIKLIEDYDQAASSPH